MKRDDLLVDRTGNVKRWGLQMEPQPALTILGIYHVPHMDTELRNQLRQFYFFGNAIEDRGSSLRKYIERCIPLVLFEIQLEGLDARFSIADFTQPQPQTFRRAWQAPYDEAILTADGSRVLVRNAVCTRGLRGGRIAFYFHYYDPQQPMRWTYGEFGCPPVLPIPQRLWVLMPYSTVD